jgi:hypothetical protein
MIFQPSEVTMRLVTLLTLALGLFAGCGGGDCTAAHTCVCVDGCSLSCPTSGCSFECDGNAPCNLDCPKGGCTATANGNGTVTLSCAGGGCTLNNPGNGASSITNCPSCACNKIGNGSCTKS